MGVVPLFRGVNGHRRVVGAAGGVAALRECSSFGFLPMLPLNAGSLIFSSFGEALLVERK